MSRSTNVRCSIPRATNDWSSLKPLVKHHGRVLAPERLGMWALAGMWATLQTPGRYHSNQSKTISDSQLVIAADRCIRCGETTDECTCLHAEDQPTSVVSTPIPAQRASSSDAPPRARPLLATALLAVAGIAVACTLVIVLVVVVRVANARPAPLPIPQPAATTTASDEPPAVAPPPTPQDELTALADHDRSSAEQLVGYWVPQVSSKAFGTVADGRSYTYADILANYQQLRNTYSDALLVHSDDFSTFTSAGYWVTIIGEPFGTAAGANGWCDSHGIDADNCFAKRLSHSDSPSGNTVHR